MKQAVTPFVADAISAAAGEVSHTMREILAPSVATNA